MPFLKVYSNAELKDKNAAQFVGRASELIAAKLGKPIGYVVVSLAQEKTMAFGGSAENSILYKLGVLIEPVTMFFGLKWQAFLAFCASAISKESLLGVLNTLYGTGGSLVSSTFGAKVSGTAAAGISQILSANFTKAEGLAFIFAISFNMPCVSALAATARETHSVKWTAKIGVFYTLASLLIACAVYHIGLLVF